MYYFAHQIDREVKEIYYNTFIVNLALSITTLFEPIFLYGLGYSLLEIMWFYMLVYFGYSLLIFVGAKFVSRFGYKHSILLSNVFYIAYWILLYQIKFHPSLFVVAPFLFSLQKSFMWPAYHADIANNAVKEQRGREVGLLFALIQVASIAGPVIGGAVSAFLGFKAMFFVSSILMLLSAYPLFCSPEIYTKHRFRMINFWRIIKTYPQNFFAYWGYVEDLMLMTLWPIYLFLLVPALMDVGLLVTVASFISIVIMLYIGSVMDHRKRSHLLQISSIVYGLSWMFRQFGMSFAAIFSFDALTRTTKAMVNVPMTAITYKLIGVSSNDHAIAYGVFYEFSLSVGKMLMALGAIGILSFTGNIYHVFIFAGALTMLYGLLKGKK
jgi:MFS family permease